MASKNYPLRLPEDLHDKLKEIADLEERSLNAQIVVLLREAIEQWEEKNPKENRQFVRTAFDAILAV